MPRQASNDAKSDMMHLAAAMASKHLIDKMLRVPVGDDAVCAAVGVEGADAEALGKTRFDAVTTAISPARFVRSSMPVSMQLQQGCRRFAEVETSE